MFTIFLLIAIIFNSFAKKPHNQEYGGENSMNWNQNGLGGDEMVSAFNGIFIS